MQWKKYPKIFRLGNDENEDIFNDPEQEIVIEEKVDGGNGAFWLEQEGSDQGNYINKICFASRTRPLIGGLENGQFKSCIKWVIEQHTKSVEENQSAIDPDYIYYGEYMTAHTLPYDWDNTPRFIGFDILRKEDHTFLNRQEKEKEFKRLGLPIVPLVLQKKVKDLQIKDIEKLVPQSAYGPIQAEGIVLKAYGLTNRWGRPCWAKYVREQFKEENKKIFGDPKKEKAEDRDSFAIYKTYFTPTRYTKILQRLRDEGHPMQMSTMKEYPKALLEDFYEECLREIPHKYNSVNFKYLKQKIMKECARRLKEEELKVQHEQMQKLSGGKNAKKDSRMDEKT